MRLPVIFLSLLLPGLQSDKVPPAFTPVEKKFPLLWKAETGCASFRTNISFYGDNLIMGSNGDNFYDMNAYDKESGVYLINPKTGKIRNHFADECLGDMDVNGILIHDGKCYFGNDNEEFLCTDMSGKIIWRNPAGGDIEHEPSIIHINGKPVIVYASELGEVKAVRPETGKTVWTHYTSDFSGYKDGDNRAVFKVKAFFRGAMSFFTRPLLCDLNKDGVTDIIYNTYDDQIYSVDGRTGKLLWKFSTGQNLSSASFLIGSEADPQIAAISACNLTFNDLKRNSESYGSEMVMIDRFGNVSSRKRINVPFYEFSLNHLKTKDGSVLISSADSIFEINSKGRITAWNHRIDYLSHYGPNDEYSSMDSRAWSEGLICGSAFTYQNNAGCILLMSQHDNAHRDRAYIEILNPRTRTVLERLSLPAVSEMPPFVRDVNGDGYLDLLVNGYDGYLYCYNMKIRTTD